MLLGLLSRSRSRAFQGEWRISLSSDDCAETRWAEARFSGADVSGDRWAFCISRFRLRTSNRPSPISICPTRDSRVLKSASPLSYINARAVRSAMVAIVRAETRLDPMFAG